jgi:hypothetical protein
VCDERIVIVAMELFCKVKQRHGRFEENLNASADAIYSNDFSIAKGRIGTEHSRHSLRLLRFCTNTILTANPFFVFAITEP